jgi:WD40 repeat protein/tRNA A-37 threonylcarbamoyl transferase component Bud32/cell division protein FtsL
MSSHLNREEVLFAMLLEKPVDLHPAFLDVICAADPALRHRLEALLAAHDAPDELSPKGAPDAKTMKIEFADVPDEAVGQTLGRYKLLEKVGEGGCGVVYVAEQTEPVRRRVALKVIKLGMDTKQVVARFEAERQALAMMDHPNIAKVLDAGATDVGRPFFVMELVRGIRITDYCDQNNLNTDERLDLFIKVCQAIQHAHQKGIIHRDIKPSNILVTLHDGVPVPKVIDFGIAKATVGQTLTDKTVYTQLQQFIGTPAYMSPEQAEMSGLDIDTRSDIYSLGVLLYELLAGSTPFDANELMASGIDAMRKTIREKEPVRPSTRFATLKGEQLTTTAKRRSADKAKLMHQLKGDLDWIVMKCLEKDRTRRYETANGIAADLKRHLNNEPVTARPPSAVYKFQKAFRRNKLVFAAGAAVAIALLLGIIVAASQAIRATHAKRVALDAQAQESVQREKAETSEQKAVAAQANEAKLREQADVARHQAEAQELVARQRAYASDMNAAAQASGGNNLGRARDLLNRQRPQPGQKDLRGWEWRYLWQQTHSDALFTLCQESGEINSLAASSDGNWLAVGLHHRGGLSVWDLRKRQELIRLAEGDAHVNGAFSPTAPILAFTGYSLPASGETGRSTLRLWNGVTRQMMAEIPLDNPCEGLAFSRDGQTLVTSTYYGHITLWRMPEGTKLASYACEQGGISPATAFAATPDLSLAAQVVGLKRIRVVDLRNGKELWSAVAAKMFITALALSPDGKTLASAAGFDESDIRLWDVATGKEIGRLEGHNTWVGSIVFWPDGSKLASASADQTIRTWDVASRKCLDVLRGHREEVWRLALLPDNQTLVSGCKDGEVCLWDTSGPHPRLERITLREFPSIWQFSPDNQSILTARQRQIVRWAGTDFQEKETLLDFGQGETNNHMGSSAFSRDGRLVAVAWTNGDGQVWDVSRHVLQTQFKLPAMQNSDGALNHRGDRLIVLSGDDNRCHEWDLAARPNVELQSWPMAVEGAAFDVSPDDRLFVQLGYEGDVIVRDMAAQSSSKPDLKSLEASDCAFSPDGKLFAMASHLAYARVWETADWREAATLRGFKLGTDSVAFSPDGERLATGTGAGEAALHLWDVASWQDVFTLRAEGTIFGSTQFSPDGNTIGTESGEGILNLWRAPSWAEINAAEAKEKAVSKEP